jgi:hypothetical protein
VCLQRGGKWAQTFGVRRRIWSRDSGVYECLLDPLGVQCLRSRRVKLLIFERKRGRGGIIGRAEQLHAHFRHSKHSHPNQNKNKHLTNTLFPSLSTRDTSKPPLSSFPRLFVGTHIPPERVYARSSRHVGFETTQIRALGEGEELKEGKVGVNDLKLLGLIYLTIVLGGVSVVVVSGVRHV